MANFDINDESRRQALELLHQGAIQQIEFSHSTYQVEILDEERFWAFLQFDDEGVVSDAFCSCDLEACPHVAAAFLKIYNDKKDPLHIRFESSFWNRLAEILANHVGYSPAELSKKDKSFVFENEIHFSLKAKNALSTKKFSEIIEHRKKETPENSLKFSSLSQEEITHWKEGRPSYQLRFELSFWSDLAKYLMLLQEEAAPYTITFSEDENHLPTKISISFQELLLKVTLTSSDLSELVSTLKSVDANLKVEAEQHDNISSITYDEGQRCFHIHHRTSKTTLESKERYFFGKWTYVPHVGFYPKEEKNPLTNAHIDEKEIPFVLENYPEQISKFLTNAKIHTSPLPLTYHMEFDKGWNLHVSAYLFEKGDLEKKDSFLFGSIAYIKDKGFYPLTNLLFPKVNTVLKTQKISSFISKNRIWLNTQEGFSTHLASLETSLNYQVTKENHLIFSSFFDSVQEELLMKEFDEWIYYKGQGFFSKKSPSLGSSLYPGLSIPPSSISSFIKEHKEELENIPHFFYSQNPFSKRGLKIEVRSATSLMITPEYEILPFFSDEKLHFFGDYVYIEKKGFFELPLPLRLPERFQEPKIVSKEELASFFEHDFPKIKEWAFAIPTSLQPPHVCNLEIGSLQKQEKGLKAHFYYKTEFGTVSLSTLYEALQKHHRFLFTEAGRLDLQDESFQWIRKINMSGIETNEVSLSALDFLKLDAQLNVYAPPNEPSFESTKGLLTELREFTPLEQPDISHLKSELRLYQKTGLAWLWFLYRNGLSGLLCDEMGLGKTHQAMALMRAILNQKEKKETCRFLIVAPTSVIFHWQDKLATFLPGVKVHFFHGLKRSLKRLAKETIVLTSYGVARMEKTSLSKIPFEMVVYDEIQVAKNPESRIHKTLIEFEATMRLGLTGTPIENNLKELKALFDIVLPGYMPGMARFKDLFLNPIEKEENLEKKEIFKRMIRPFMLRRKKKEVLQELPEKSEDKSYCELSDEQKTLYQETLEKYRPTLISELKKSQGAISYVHIFSILSTLKQICDHPALIAKDPKNYKNFSSGKWDLFVELLNEARESEEKVVIFSQYLYMLDIIEFYLKEEGIEYAQIRGDTINRKEELSRFQEDPNCMVFIGSLNAAGLGIDLTSASIVILYDRWWNAARENQAIDRVHRMGQKRGVQVYKLITKGTIEEKIDLLISKKGALMEDVVVADDENQIKKFTRQELIDLLSY